MRDDSQKGEIITVITLATLAIVTVSTIISTLFINSKNKYTYKPRAEGGWKCPGGDCDKCGRDGPWERSEGCPKPTEPPTQPPTEIPSTPVISLPPESTVTSAPIPTIETSVQPSGVNIPATACTQCAANGHCEYHPFPGCTNNGCTVDGQQCPADKKTAITTAPIQTHFIGEGEPTICNIDPTDPDCLNYRNQQVNLMTPTPLQPSPNLGNSCFDRNTGVPIPCPSVVDNTTYCARNPDSCITPSPTIQIESREFPASSCTRCEANGTCKYHPELDKRSSTSNVGCTDTGCISSSECSSSGNQIIPVYPPPAPPVSVASTQTIVCCGAHQADRFIITGEDGQPAGINGTFMTNYFNEFAKANPSIVSSDQYIPMTLTVEPGVIRKNMLPQLLSSAKKNHIALSIIVPTSRDEALGIDSQTSLGKLAQQALQTDLEYAKSVTLALTNEPNTPEKSWSGGDDGYLLYKSAVLWNKDCPLCQLYLPALSTGGGSQNFINRGYQIANGFWNEVQKNDGRMPSNIKGTYYNTYGYSPDQALSDWLNIQDIWQNAARQTGIDLNKLPNDIIITEMGPPDGVQTSGNEFNNTKETAQFLENMADILAQLKTHSGPAYKKLINPATGQYRDTRYNSFDHLSRATFFTCSAPSGHAMTNHIGEVTIPKDFIKQASLKDNLKDKQVSLLEQNPSAVVQNNIYLQMTRVQLDIPGLINKRVYCDQDYKNCMAF